MYLMNETKHTNVNANRTKLLSTRFILHPNFENIMLNISDCNLFACQQIGQARKIPNYERKAIGDPAHQNFYFTKKEKKNKKSSFWKLYLHYKPHRGSSEERHSPTCNTADEQPYRVWKEGKGFQQFIEFFFEANFYPS